MKAINCCFFTGRLTQSAEFKNPSPELAITTFSVAVNDIQKSKEKPGEYADRASFFDCVLFGNLGKAILQRLTKGADVSVIARARQDRWTANGVPHSKITFIVSDIIVHGGAKKEAKGEEMPPTVSAILDEFGGNVEGFDVY